MAKPHVLVQVGHDEPHQPGHEGETGAAGELELVRKIGRALMRRLNADDRLEAERIPGRFPTKVTSGDWAVDVFVALHGDGGPASATGYSFGFPPSSRKSKRFADVLGREFATFHISEARRNNGTSNLTGYYGWDLLPGSPAACVVEHGFLSNARERAWMHEHVQELADGEYRAILAQLGLETDNAPARTAARPDHDARWPWFVEWSLWTLGRGEYAEFGPRNRAVRPESAPTPVPRRAHSILRELQKPPGASTPPPKPGEPTRVTTRSLFLAPPRATKARVARYVVGRPHFPRTDEEARLIAELYHEIASSGGLDPVLVTAQMVLETGNLRSRWSQPPHRNMAGIGVTSSEMDPDDVPKFRSWKAAVTGHVGRLLAYAIPLGEENATQRKLIGKALEARLLDDSKRGIARSPRGLTGTWAADPDYATSIVRVANEILKD
jgi:hypothetical protein